ALSSGSLGVSGRPLVSEAPAEAGYPVHRHRCTMRRESCDRRRRGLREGWVRRPAAADPSDTRPQPNRQDRIQVAPPFLLARDTMHQNMWQAAAAELQAE